MARSARSRCPLFSRTLRLLRLLCFRHPLRLPLATNHPFSLSPRHSGLRQALRRYLEPEYLGQHCALEQPILPRHTPGQSGAVVRAGDQIARIHLPKREQQLRLDVESRADWCQARTSMRTPAAATVQSRRRRVAAVPHPIRARTRRPGARRDARRARARRPPARAASGGSASATALCECPSEVLRLKPTWCSPQFYSRSTALARRKTDCHTRRSCSACGLPFP